MDAGQFQCRVCSKRYKRREHLQRHSSSHSSDRPHRCAACDSTFQRTDVLRRHIRTCSGRETDSCQVSGRRRSCSRCIRLKKACNSALPCQRCLSQGVQCQYSAATPTSGRKQSDASTIELPNPIDLDPDFSSFERSLMPVTAFPLDLPNPQLGNMMPSPSDTPFFPAGLDYSSLSWQDFLTMTSESQTLRTPPIMDTDCTRSLRFLNKFTSNTGLVASFDCGTEAQRTCILSPVIQGSTTWLDNSLSLKTHQILLLVKEVVTIKPRNSAVSLDWSPVLEQMCLEFFSPPSLRKYLEFYWAIWHPNVNIIHRPSFDPVQAKPAVLATMALIGRSSHSSLHYRQYLMTSTGACVSPDPSDNQNAQTWFNCVEELVFIDEDFNSDVSFSSGSLGARRNKIQALQAAYMVCLYQTWEGGDASKRRIRRNRFATLVSVSQPPSFEFPCSYLQRQLGISVSPWPDI